MLITRSQGAACRRAAELTARECHGPWSILGMFGYDVFDSLSRIGWDCDKASTFTKECGAYDQSQVLMALLWCAEIAGEE